MLFPWSIRIIGTNLHILANNSNRQGTSSLLMNAIKSNGIQMKNRKTKIFNQEYLVSSFISFLSFLFLKLLFQFLQPFPLHFLHKKHIFIHQNTANDQNSNSHRTLWMIHFESAKTLIDNPAANEQWNSKTRRAGILKPESNAKQQIYLV